MWWTLTIVLLLLWLIGLVSGLAVGVWVHVLLLLAILALVANMIRNPA